MVVMAVVLSAASCSGGDRPLLIGETDRAVGDAPVERPEAEGAEARPDPGADEDPTSVEPSAESDDGVEPTDDGTNSSPEITDEIVEAGGGVRAVLSPTGIVLPVLGRTGNGYVVQTPCEARTELRWGQPITGAQVVLDPGHGGDEKGAVADDGAGGPLTEAALNLDLARRTAAELSSRSISVVLTRNADYRVTVEQRANIADAIQSNAFVSIHHNSGASAASTSPGSEVYVQQGSDESRRLGGLLYEEVFGTLSDFDVEWTARSDAGVLTVLDGTGDDFYGINRYPTTVSALVEMAYLGNPREVELVTTDDYMVAAARALADGIERFLTTTDPGTGFIDAARPAEASGDTGGESGCIDPRLE